MNFELGNKPNKVYDKTTFSGPFHNSLYSGYYCNQTDMDANDPFVKEMASIFYDLRDTCLTLVDQKIIKLVLKNKCSCLGNCLPRNIVYDDCTSLVGYVFECTRTIKTLKLVNIDFIDSFIIRGLKKSITIEKLKICNSNSETIITHVLPYNRRIKDVVIDEGKNIEKNLKIFKLFNNPSIKLNSVKFNVFSIEEITRFINVLINISFPINNLILSLHAPFPPSIPDNNILIRKTNLIILINNNIIS